MTVEIIQEPWSAELICGEAAAACTGSKNKQSALEHAVASGHNSVLEHAVYTFKISGISRACLAQLTRHRIASFSVQSQRYSEIQDNDLIIPESLYEHYPNPEVTTLMADMVTIYHRLIKAGVPAEDARYILPQAIPTTLIMTMNARELRHFFSLRCCNRAQWEIRKLADEMLWLCKESSPDLFKDAGPGCVNAACPEEKPCGHPRWEVAPW